MGSKSLTELMNDIIISSYPELKEIPILINYKNESDYMASSYNKKKNMYIIDVNPTTKKAPIDAKKGGIAHELSHIALDHRLCDKPGKSFDLCRRSEYYKRIDEIAADTDAVLRGYGPHIIRMIKYLGNKFRDDAYAWHIGLSTLDIELLIGKRELPQVP